MSSLLTLPNPLTYLPFQKPHSLLSLVLFPFSCESNAFRCDFYLECEKFNLCAKQSINICRERTQELHILFGWFHCNVRYALKEKKTILFGNFSQQGGGGLPKSQNFCKFTKYFFVCQIHFEVLKHVLQMGG